MWVEELVNEMVKRGVPEVEAWKRAERLWLEDIKEESRAPWWVDNIVEILEKAGFEIVGGSFSDRDFYGVYRAKVSKIGDIELVKEHVDDVEVNGDTVEVWYVF